MPEEEVTLVHISDLHFSEGTDASRRGHHHSIPHLKGVEERLRNLEFDRLILSGDITNNGDTESLLRARGWLLDKLQIGGGKTTGLELDPKVIGVVPGNHDAWNTDKSGSPLEIWQRSLDNYNQVFVEHRMAPTPMYYDWLEKDGWGVFIAYVDSCFLGDPQIEKRILGRKLFDGIAKGKLSVQQSQRLLEWFDRGVRGTLPYPNDQSKTIPGELFSYSLKICVMHHYIFEPPEHKSEYLMRVTNRDMVFRNIAMADFDVLLCGHKHIADFHTYNYGDLLDRRSGERHLLNYFRRIIGANSLPLQYTDAKGKPLTRYATMFINWLCVNPLPEGGDRAGYVDDLAKLLCGVIKKPAAPLHIRYGAPKEIDPEELQEIQERVRSMSKGERARLEAVAPELKKVIAQLSNRPFLQIMCGSSTKATSLPGKDRSFNVYKINKTEGSYLLKSERYTWDNASASFSQRPLVMAQPFEEFRRPTL